MERNYPEEFFSNIRLLDRLLKPINQGILNYQRPRGIIGWLLSTWPIWYNCCWIIFYTYLIFVERALPRIISQQILSLMCITQLVAKLSNGVVNYGKIHKLLRWCEDIYTAQYRDEYKSVVNRIFEQTNFNITLCIRINCGIIGTAAISYVLQPLINGNRETPAIISVNGETYWPLHIFLAIYGGQMLYAFCVFFILCAYDVIFIQCVLSMSYRFRTMCELLKLLNYPGSRDNAKDKEIIIDVYLMHLSLLRSTALFRQYYYFYGLVQLGSNLFMNCALLFIMQTNGYDFNGLVILISSSLQILIVSAFGQELQNEANHFRETFCTAIDWPKLSGENKKSYLLLMTGSGRPVTIRAGGTFELNLDLFVQVMKTGASLCAVLQAM